LVREGVGIDSEVNRFLTRFAKEKGPVTQDHGAFTSDFTPPLPADVQIGAAQ